MTERTDAALAHGHLERGQDDIGPLARPHGDGGEVAARPRGGIAGEVFERGDDPGRLQSSYVGRGDGAHEVRVLADGLLDAPPAHVAYDVQDRGESLVYADGTHVTADRGGHLVDQLRMEGGAPGQWYRVGGRTPGGEAGKALLVRQCRYAEPVRAHDPLLGTEERESTDGGVDRGCSERAGQLSEAVGKQVVECDGLPHVVLERGDFASLVGRAHPDAEELGDLLLEGHGGDQGVSSVLGGAGRIVPGPGAVVRGPGARCPGSGGRRRTGVVHIGGHFPPTPISPCTRARRANR